MGGGVEQLERGKGGKGGKTAGTSLDTGIVSQLLSNVENRIPSM